MHRRILRPLFLPALGTLLVSGLWATSSRTQGLDPVIPRTWDEESMEGLHVPLAHPEASPEIVAADFYYAIPPAAMYRTYPVYHPDREPPGYLDSLAQVEPEVVFDASELETDADWVAAGAVVFDTPIPPFFSIEQLAFVRDPDFYSEQPVRLAADGTLPGLRYVVRERGRVEISGGCSFCHTRVLDDGTVVYGAQGNQPIGAENAYMFRRLILDSPAPEAVLRQAPFLNPAVRASAPWLENDPNRRMTELPLTEMPNVWESFPPGVIPRHSGPLFPVATPDLIGVRNRAYFDRTGFIRHRSIGDLMRYASLVAGLDRLYRFGPYIEPPALGPTQLTRYSDAQLYALARYIYALEPPPNPNPRNADTRRGEAVFAREGCGNCHTPPLYTNNALTPAEGFQVSRAQRARDNVLPVVVGTDPGLALESRRGTGFYKVPSLLGVWYRGPFGHSGSARTLEDWFDPDRLDEDYVPTGFRGYETGARPVPGHRFGLDLDPEEKAALIAFLRTL